MTSVILSLLAQATAPTSQPSQPPGWIIFFQNPLILMAVVMVVLLFLSSSSKRKQEREKKEQLDRVKRGDRIQTIGGILGKVVETETDRVLVKVDESSNTKIWFTRSAINKVLGEEKEKSDGK